MMMDLQKVLKESKAKLESSLVSAVFRNIAPTVCHLSWVSYQIGAGQEYNIVITEQQQKSLENGVENFLKDPNATPQKNHSNWMMFKISEGWRYGKVKDEKKRTHPDLKPWSKLPKVEQNKDIQYQIAMKEAYRLAKIIASAASEAISVRK